MGNFSGIRARFPVLALVLIPTTLGARAGDVSDEGLEARRFLAAVSAGVVPSPAARPGLEVVANYDQVQKNTRFGKPLKLAGQKHARGLFCHAPSRIVVHLPGPGKAFQARVGVDSNEQTVGGRGSVAFQVTAGGRPVFRSPVLREGGPPQSVKVDLDGTTDLTLEVGDGGDGISCDQADWADASVTLTDGRTLWLDELPTPVGPVVATPGEPPFSFRYGGLPSSQLLKTWGVERTTRKLDGARTEWSVVYTDPRTALQVRCVGVQYHDFPTVEWTLRMRNTGTAPTPLLEDIQPLDLRLARGHYGEFLLHHAVGSPCAVNDY